MDGLLLALPACDLPRSSSCLFSTNLRITPTGVGMFLGLRALVRYWLIRGADCARMWIFESAQAVEAYSMNDG